VVHALSELAAWQSAGGSGASKPFKVLLGRFGFQEAVQLTDAVGCRIFLKALASIWRIRSRVTLNCLPTSSRVRGSRRQAEAQFEHLAFAFSQAGEDIVSCPSTD